MYESGIARGLFSRVLGTGVVYRDGSGVARTDNGVTVFLGEHASKVGRLPLPARHRGPAGAEGEVSDDDPKLLLVVARDCLDRCEEVRQRFVPDGKGPRDCWTGATAFRPRGSSLEPASARTDELAPGGRDAPPGSSNTTASSSTAG